MSGMSTAIEIHDVTQVKYNEIHVKIIGILLL